MILDNYWNYKATIETLPISSNGNRVTQCGLYNTSGESKTIGTGFLNVNNDVMNNYSIKAALGILVGTGDTAPQGSDYALEADVTSSIANLAFTCTSGGDGTSQRTVITASGVNNSGSSLTLKEIGIKKSVLPDPYYSSSFTDILFVRHILKTPIELAAGESFSITFEWVEA